MARQARSLYHVFWIYESGFKKLAGSTWAVSPEQAINNVRWRLAGKTPQDCLTRGMFAEQVARSRPVYVGGAPIPNVVPEGPRVPQQLMLL